MWWYQPNTHIPLFFVFIALTHHIFYSIWNYITLLYKRITKRNSKRKKNNITLLCILLITYKKSVLVDAIKMKRRQEMQEIGIKNLWIIKSLKVFIVHVKKKKTKIKLTAVQFLFSLLQFSCWILNFLFRSTINKDFSLANGDITKQTKYMYVLAKTAIIIKP